MADLRDPVCNFCGKTQSQVHNLITCADKPNLSICNECVVLCLHLMEESDPEWFAGELKAQGFPRSKGTSN
jgi:ATP-dependent protease Clp ATPase subunit